MGPPRGPDMPKTDHRKDLTPTLIKGLRPAPEGDRYQVMDAVVPGFGVRVTDRGTKTFIMKTRFPGYANPARREIGNCSTMTLADARQKARRWRELIDQALDPAVEEERARQEAARQRAITFAAVAKDFIAQKLPGERKGKDVEREITGEAILSVGGRSTRIRAGYLAMRDAADLGHLRRRPTGTARPDPHR
jgi:hypothetical protein